MAMPERRGGRVPVGGLKHFGWGREGEGLSAEEEDSLLARYRRRFDVDRFDEVQPPRLTDIALSPPRITPPAALAAICATDLYARAAHTHGKSFPDTVRGLLGDYRNAPDVVAFPRDENEVAAVLAWAAELPALVIPFGGGSSVVGGIDAAVDQARFKAAITLD